MAKDGLTGKALEIEPSGEPDREKTGGTSFSSGQPVHLEADVDAVIESDSSTQHTITLVPRGSAAGGSTFTRVLLPFGQLPISGRGISEVDIDLADANVFVIMGRRGTVFPSSSSVLVPKPVVVDSQTAAPTTLANGSAETVIVAGATVIPVGTLIRYALSMDGAVATPGDKAYVAIKGHTSAAYIAVAMPGQSSQSAIRMSRAAGEKVDIVAANGDTVAHNYSATWSAQSGE